MFVFKEIVLNNFDLTIEKGSFTSIIGPIGGGKTKLLNQIYKKTNNKFIVSYIDENYEFRGTMREELTNVLLLNNVATSEIKSRIKRVLKQLNIYDLIYKTINELSKLDKKRFLLAYALIINPDVLLIDNLLAEFGKQEAETILKYLKRQCCKGMTIVFTTYNLEYSLFVDKVLVLTNDNILFYAKPIEVFENEKILNNIGIGIPFMIDLSLKLKTYGLISKVVTDMDRMVDYIWK